jgi:formylglycine-generating enzyme
VRRGLWIAGVGVAFVPVLGSAWAHPPGAAHPLGTRARCAIYSGLPDGWPASAEAGMVRIAGGDFEPGSQHGYADERPAGRVHVDAFWIDRTEVTNAEFAAFVRATGYVTEAEREGGAPVFSKPTDSEAAPLSWWRYERGASWQHPDGPATDIARRGHEPVVQVTLADAGAYARWLGHELPTEAQWEFAAREGKDGAPLDEAPRTEAGTPAANFWQGTFPAVNTREDGFESRAPVGCFPANAPGLFDMIGNVWELTRDSYRGSRQAHGAGPPPRRGGVTDETDADSVVMKGGSYLCARTFCARYRAAARYPQERHLGAPHVGFRTVKPDD